MLWSVNDTVEDTKRGIIAGIRTQDIYDSLSNKEKLSSLEEILKADKEKLKRLQLFGVAGTKVKKDEEEAVLKEAKASVDCFFSLDPEHYNPSLDIDSFFRGSLGFMLLTGGFTSIGVWRILSETISNTQANPTIVSLAAITLLASAAGLSAGIGASLLGSRIYTHGEYDAEKNQIIGLRSRRNLFKYMLLREYTRAVSIDRIRKQPLAYMPFESGFAEGVACHLMSGYDKEQAVALRQAKKRLKQGTNFLQMRTSKFKEITKKLDEDKIPREHNKGLMGMGYCFFRLAEERHGADVYREVYSGNTRILFE